MPFQFSPLAKDLSLPQDDDHEQRRASQLEEAQDAYRYTYAKPNLRGIAMVADPPKSDHPGPEWLKEVGEVAAEIIDNGVQLAAAEGRTPPSELGELLGRDQKRRDPAGVRASG